LVLPLTVRPVSGVWASVSSRPLPPALTGVEALLPREEEGPEAFGVVDGRVLRVVTGRRDVLLRELALREAAARLREVAAALREVAARLRELPALREDAATPLRLPFRCPGRGGIVAFLRLALPRGGLAAVAFRRPPAVRAFARAPAPALRLDGVSFRPRFLPWVFALFFLTICASGG
jgi:hypothetical protein